MNFFNGSNTTSGELLYFFPNPNLNVVRAVVFTVSSLLLEAAALLSNTFLIVNLAKKSPVSPSSHLMINLCLANLLESLLCFIVYTAPVAANSWFLGSIMCKVLPYLLEGFRTFSIAILTILARYRCYAISQPLKNAKHKKVRMYLELFAFACWGLGAEIGNGFKRNKLYHVEEETRCVEFLHLRSRERINIAISYFAYILVAHIQQMYYFIRIACALWKSSKHLGENKSESSQRLKRNKKAMKTIFFMVVVYDFLFIPTATLKSLALYHDDLSEFREFSNILQLIHCSFNATFYIWRDEKLKKTVTHFFGRLFCRG